jgi:hypothetical protein
VPLFADTSAAIGRAYFYRVRAVSAAGASAPSNAVGPVRIAARVFVDPMRSLDLMHAKAGKLAVVQGDDRRFREALSRVEAEPASEIVYSVGGPIRRIQVDAFSEAADPLTLHVSADGKTYAPVEAQRQTAASGKEDYGYSIPTRYVAAPGERARFVKIVARHAMQLTRVEIEHR